MSNPIFSEKSFFPKTFIQRMKKYCWSKSNGTGNKAQSNKVVIEQGKYMQKHI
jgi:hypothetical protein